MIVVRIELHSTRTGKITEIGRMLIDNISRLGNHSKRGSYRVRILRRGTFKGKTLHIAREGVLHNFPRLSYTVWRLVFRALKSVLHEEK